MIKTNGGHTEALITFLLLYFVCNVEYPKECLNVYLFLQRYILKVCDNARLPTKLLQFLNEQFFYFLCFVGEFKIENNKSENKRTHRIQLYLQLRR